MGFVAFVDIYLVLETPGLNEWTDKDSLQVMFSPKRRGLKGFAEGHK